MLRSPWARTIIAMGFIESLFMYGGFAYVGADLHLRFGLNFAVVGLFVGTFAIGGLIYSLSVRRLVERLGQIGLATGGGVILAITYAAVAFAPHTYVAPLAITAIGLGFYMLHNTLQTNATQMTPEARATAVGIFSAALYFGQTLGVAINAPIFDRFSAVPIFVMSGAGLLVLGLWLAHGRPDTPFHDGDVAEWLRSGLQIRVRRFDSGRRLQPSRWRPFILSKAVWLCYRAVAAARRCSRVAQW